MAQKRLSHDLIRKADRQGLHSDGGNLYLRISPAGGKSFVVRVTAGGVRKDITLGQFPKLGLVEARKMAREELKAARSTKKDQLAPARVKREKASITFADCSDKYIEAHKVEWTKRHYDGWVQTMRDYAGPVIGTLHPASVNVQHLKDILDPIWATKTETAVRVRSRVEAILDWAMVMGHRSAEKPNPARWKGNLEHLLANRNKVAPVSHHAALPYRDIPAFIAKLRASTDFATPALLFTILIAARSGEARGAVWSEVDLTSCEWIIPASRMKAAKEHRVPLGPEASLMLARMPEPHRPKDLVFQSVRTGHKNGALISPPSFASLLKELGYGGLTTHGFRSTFRDWAAETTDYANEVVEMCLAHAIGSKVEAAYRRGNLLEKRRRLMEEWEAYCFSSSI